MLYILFTADLPTNDLLTTSTFADDTAILSSHKECNNASQILGEHLQQLEIWLANWRIRVNESKSAHVTFTLRKDTCPSVTVNSVTIPQAKEVVYLGIHLDRRLTWRKHIEAKRT